ncbi:MAG: hypothetical protein FVQ77_08520 [Cytophagales bacterium]|nr:hypothetical protein [Cytophagales bacterium]
MKTLKVPINELDYAKFGFNADKIPFTELKEKISIEIAKQALIKCQTIAQKTGLSKMTLKKINDEIRAVRKNAKNRH